jgi:putative aldouronate transport system permease protein|nr:carbohydrate ABC transporter permease [uncultured Acetatifactor sp.]
MKTRRHSSIHFSRILFQILNYTFFILFTFICMYPFWYIIIYTLSDPAAVKGKIPFLLPIQFTLKNYAELLKTNGLMNAFGISVARTVLGTTFTVLSSTFLGYLFSKKEMPCRKLLYRFVIITMYISGGLISTFLVMKSYHLLNSFWIYVIPGAVSAYNVILVKTYVEQLPESLEEAARTDGAGYLTIFGRIILPLSKPIIATIGTFSAIGQWNSWFDNHIYASANTDITTLQYLLYKYLQEAQKLAEKYKNSLIVGEQIQEAELISPMGIRLTITVISCVPIFLVYPFAQRYFTRGLTLGAVKG